MKKLKEYKPEVIEKKWQKYWDVRKFYQAKDFSKKPKFYSLFEFNYPSGNGLHVGHVRTDTAMDIISRKRRMQGYNVLYPVGWDSFGLPTENYAIKTGISPQLATKQNTNNFRRQMKSLGISVDWSREIDTSDPKYYKWTQWIFLQMFKKGLAYKTKTEINWCPRCKIGLANEEVVDGKCERCGNPVEKREKEQWMLAITKYADRLDKDLDLVDYLPKIKIQQRNWIGRSEGALIKFSIFNFQFSIEVFTTRPDTLFGATYLVVAPENKIIQRFKPACRTGRDSKIENWEEVENYINSTKNKTEIERTAENKEKTGVKIEGITAINPATGEEIPIFVADYVLGHYGTGAIMAVPAHDERDRAFAEKYNLPIKTITPDDGLAEKFGKKVVKYKLRDWVFSRQRYWGEPIPLVNCNKCGWVAVPEKDLPVKLPPVKKYEPTDNGESPLSALPKWVNTKCPKCKGPAKRETDTMPNWAGSSWYYLRYVDPKNNKSFADKKSLKYWLGVDWYNGGMEHTTLHLLYSRFWHKFLYDQKLVPTKEPYQKRTSHGMILAKNGEKMSKSRGNVVNPDTVVKTWGADSLRLYEMFMGPFGEDIAWNTDNIAGVRRFLERVWKMQFKANSKIKNYKNLKIESLIHKTIKKVSGDIEEMKFNTAISSLMICSNELSKEPKLPKNILNIFITLLAPFAPHIVEEIWKNFGNIKSVHLEKWPKYDPQKIKESEVIIVVQINGKIRAQLQTLAGAKKDEVIKQVMEIPEVKKWLEGKTVKKDIFIEDKILNLIIG